MQTERRNVLVLAICQTLLLVNNSTVLAVNALAGRHVLAGGLLGGLIGPQLNNVTVGLFTTEY